MMIHLFPFDLFKSRVCWFQFLVNNEMIYCMQYIVIIVYIFLWTFTFGQIERIVNFANLCCEYCYSNVINNISKNIKIKPTQNNVYSSLIGELQVVFVPFCTQKDSYDWLHRSYMMQLKLLQVGVSLRVLCSYCDRNRVFSLNFWWGDSKFSVPVGDKVGWGGGELAQKSDWSQNCPPNAIRPFFAILSMKYSFLGYFWA